MTNDIGESAYVYAAVRTPFGKFNGGLAGVRPDDLAATALTGVLATVPDLDPQDIGDVVWGNANGAGEDNRNVGRMAVLLSGLPVTVPATTVNRLCGSSLDAAMMETSWRWWIRAPAAWSRRRGPRGCSRNRRSRSRQGTSRRCPRRWVGGW